MTEHVIELTFMQGAAMSSLIALRNEAQARAQFFTERAGELRRQAQGADESAADCRRRADKATEQILKGIGEEHGLEVPLDALIEGDEQAFPVRIKWASEGSEPALKTPDDPVE